MKNRQGFTLAELLVALVLTMVAGGVIVGMLTNTQRVARSQADQVELQSNVRSGAQIVLAELREVGYRDDLTRGVLTSDVLAMGPDWIQFRTPRGMGFTCGVPVFAPPNMELRVRLPLVGGRNPTVQDDWEVFFEMERDRGTDDLWLPVVVSNVDLLSDCAGLPAMHITFTTPTIWTPSNPDAPVTATQFQIAAPVRIFERIQMGLYSQGGQSWLGMRNLSIGEAAYSPVVGPLDPATGFSLTYYDANNNVVPVTGNPALVRSIEVTINGLTDAGVALAGQSRNTTGNWNLRTRVALRNTLRP